MCNGPEKQAPKKYSNRSDCGPERHAAVLKSEHPKSILIVDIADRKDVQVFPDQQWLPNYVLRYWVDIAFPDRHACLSGKEDMSTIQSMETNSACFSERELTGLSGPGMARRESSVLGKLLFSGPFQSGFRTSLLKIRVRFGCYLSCSGPLQNFPDRNVYN